MSPAKLAAPRKQAQRTKISFAAPSFKGASLGSSTGSGHDKLLYETKSTSKTDKTPYPGQGAQPRTMVTASVIETNTNEEHQAKSSNTALPSGAEPTVLDDLLTAALSLHDEDSLATLSVDLFCGQEVGLTCADFCSAPSPKASSSLETVPPDPFESYPIQYSSRLSTTLVAHPPAHAFFIPIASSTDNLSSNYCLTNPVVNKESTTVVRTRHPSPDKFATTSVDESHVYSPGHKVLSRRPSAENFARYWSDEYPSERPSPVPTCETSQTIASFLGREEELAQEADNDREVTPRCGMVTMTLYDLNGRVLAPMSPCRGMISPIDRNASQGDDSPIEAWYVDITSPTEAPGEKDSFLFSSPVETDNVVDKRFLMANLKTTDALQNQWCQEKLMHVNPTPYNGWSHQGGSCFASLPPVGIGTNWVGVGHQGTAQATKRNGI
jgi:hypothetical protein